ncbi:hypothetical protein ONS95_010860 [Cadophora gregata]|uniref:uncharacterized protein n=1 Tax=Cadophora gregata TaxID=51156 RepID=UPI0026DB62C9|nr:uncharacterized protein ONS95_010860 [Cadophora gregata]KAK0119408.1 hypothetical protein ONS95_010860 [Cadophora gregata]KAK0120444.1 hypothetical protein ONS96_010658 [Cadophora gregata f. sp. sojae]
MVHSRSLLLGALLATVRFTYAQDTSDTGLSCDDLLVTIDNSTQLSFYSSCPSLEYMVGPSHAFSGPFNLPGVENIGKFSAGYLGPKFTGSQRVDDRVTTVSMPDLVNTTSGGVLFGYLDNLTSVDFPKLNTITGDIVLIGNYETKTLTLPALANVTGGGLLDGHFDSISLPSLKTIGYLIVKSTGSLDCVALGKNLSSLTFTPKQYDVGVGFTCWTPDEKNTWNSSEVNGGSGGSPTTTGSGGPAAGTSSAASGAENLMRGRGVGMMVGLVAGAVIAAVLL